MCSMGMHSSCTGCACTHNATPVGDTHEVFNKDQDNDNSTRRTSSRVESGRSSITRGGKRDATLKDQQSTGRKRAARLYPLDSNAACEWQGKSNCGGGKSPILGCSLGKQQARHHGPDKSTSNNEEGNVHRICHACHNRWHAANNAEYDWNDTTVKPHQPREQTVKEQEEAMMVHMTYSLKNRKIIKD